MILSPHQPARLHPTPDTSMYYFYFLGVYLTHHPHSEGLLLNELSLDSGGCEDYKPFILLIFYVLDPSLAKIFNQLSTFDIIFDPIIPGK